MVKRKYTFNHLSFTLSKPIFLYNILQKGFFHISDILLKININKSETVDKFVYQQHFLHDLITNQ